MSFDIVIVGGGVMGLSTAWHLLDREPGLRVCVIERDPTYEFASTPRSLGGVRQQFSVAENIRMSQYGRQFYTVFAETMAVDGEKPDIGYRVEGYLFLLPEEARAQAQELNDLQRSLGATTEMLDPAGIAVLFPSLNLDDIAFGTYGPEDGWTDPYAIVMGFRKKVREMGIAYRQGGVASIATADGRATGVVLEDGSTVAAGQVVCAAGAWSNTLLATAGVEVPVVPVRRMVFFFEIQQEIEPLPLTIAPDGLYFRPEGRGYLTGHSIEEPEGINFEVDDSLFEESIWPALAERVPAFEALRQTNAWSGLYDINKLDENMVCGPHPEGPANLHILCGFSGHGLQQAPAAGRATSELILDGGFTTLDLSRLSAERLVTGAAVHEVGIV
ncbi:MAG: FAD-binding oxidoreductase [Rhodospirillales bacterium]|nr:FAD-binding oxidoreductase [Rhodospirillales bacterium]